MIVNVFVIIVCTVLVLLSIKRIVLKRYSYLHICSFLFYTIQVVSLAYNLFVDIDELRTERPYIGYAMKSETVNLLYGSFCIITMLLLYYFGNKFAKYRLDIDRSSFEKKHNVWAWFLVIPMYIPLLGVIFAPSPEIYSVFSYFYTHSVAYSSIELIYHNEVMSYLNLISFASIIICYTIKGKKDKLNIIIAVAILLVTWIDGKRTLTTFMLVSIIAIDFIKIGKNVNSVKLLWKSVAFLSIIIGYFVVYGMVTRKSEDVSSADKYNSYFSREGEVKLSIYSRTEGQKMIEYDGQSLLYNLTFYVPRVFWEDKPYGFFNYITSYSFSGNGDTFVVGSNLQVNLWSEFIANFGVLGYVLAILFILWVIKKSERTSNVYINLFGSIFIYLYFVYGFEKVSQIVFYLWFFLLFKQNIKKRWRSKPVKRIIYSK